MKQQFGLIRRPWGTYYLKDKTTGEQTSLKTKDKEEAQRLLNAHNDATNQPQFSLALALVRLLARKDGRAMTNAEIAQAAEWTELQVMYLSTQTSWERVSVSDLRAFTRACGMDFTSRADTNRIECYMRRNHGHPSFKYLTKDKDWKTNFLPLIVSWRRSLKTIPTALPAPIRRLLENLK